VGVEWRLAFFDDPHELSEIPAHVTRVNHQFEMPVASGRNRLLLGLVDCDLVIGSQECVSLKHRRLARLGRHDRHEDELIPSRINHVARLAGRNQHAGVHKEGMSAIFDDRVASATDDEQNLFGIVVVKRDLTALAHCNDPLNKVLASNASIDCRARVRARAHNSDVVEFSRIDDERAIQFRHVGQLTCHDSDDSDRRTGATFDFEW